MTAPPPLSVTVPIRFSVPKSNSDAAPRLTAPELTKAPPIDSVESSSTLIVPALPEPTLTVSLALSVVPLVAVKELLKSIVSTLKAETPMLLTTTVCTLLAIETPNAPAPMNASAVELGGAAALHSALLVQLPATPKNTSCAAIPVP